MKKQEIEIAGYKIVQLSETAFEAENKEQNLDFYFEINEENEVDVFVFDSFKSSNSCVDPLIYSTTVGTIDEAVKSVNLNIFR